MPVQNRHGFEDFINSRVSLQKPNGQRIDDIPASVQSKGIYIFDATLPIEDGDTIERERPGGIKERFTVLDAGYHPETLGITAHFQIKVRKQSSTESAPQIGTTTNQSDTAGLQLERSHSEMQSASEQIGDPKKVFIVYGRNIQALNAMKQFLRALHLEPIDFDEVRNQLGHSAYLHDVVREGMNRARAIIVLFTPDEYAALRPNLIRSHDTATDKARWQTRPNVIWEAGAALTIAAERTLLVRLGDVDLSSDMQGRYVYRLDNSIEARNRLRDALRGARCDVNPSVGDFHNKDVAGDFEACVTPPALPEVGVISPFRDNDV